MPKQALIIPLKELKIPKKMSSKEMNNLRNECVDKIIECREKGIELFQKYREFLGQYQQIMRDKNEAEDRLVEVSRRIRLFVTKIKS